MSQREKLRYEDFWDSINVDSFYEAIGWEPEFTHNDNDTGFCLFPDNHTHGDTTGKFAIHREKRVYNCWACGGGSLLSLAMELKDLDVDEATEWLYQFTEADARSDTEFVDDFLDAFRDAERRIATLPFFNERVLDRFDETIPSWWLEERGINSDIATDSYHVRYGSKIRRPAPIRGRYADDEDYHGPGIVLPHYWNGRLVGWQTRWLDEDRPEWLKKYTNTTDFPKETTIYGRDQAGPASNVIVIESVASVLFLASMGYAAVATFGSNVNEAQLRILRRYPNIILAADSDKAGVKWRNDLTEYLKKYSHVEWLPLLDEGQDIGDIAGWEDPHDWLETYLRDAYEPGIDPEPGT